MATEAQIKQVQDAYFAINRVALNTTVANATADAIANGTTSLDAYIATQLTQTVATTQAAVAIAAFVTGVTPTSAKLTELKVQADLQFAAYTKLGVANPQLGAYEAFGKGFASTPEFIAKYGAVAGPDFINAVYTSVYGSTPTAGAFANLTSQLAYFTTLYTAAGLADAANQAKGAVLGQIVGYAFVTSASASATIDNQVAASLTAAAKGDANAYGTALPAGAGNVGQSFSLTVGADAIAGTAGSDTVGAIVTAVAGQTSTLTAIDKIDGGAGVDRLVVQADTAYNGGATITNVEEIILTSTGTTFNASGIAGLTLVGSNASSGAAAFTNVGSIANVLVQNTNQNITVGYSDAAIAGAADAVKVTLDNITGSMAVTLNSTTSTTGATGFETINVAAVGPIDPNATVTLTTNTTQATKTINFSGATAQSIALAGTLGTTATTLDATASAGGVTISGLGAVDTTFKGGAGSDSVLFGANFTLTDVVDGGAGTDTLGANAAQLAAIIVKDANITNVETIRVQDDLGANASIDLAFFGATNVRVAAQAVGAEILTVNNLGANAGIRFDGVQNGTVLNVKDATLPGTADVANIDLRGAAVTYTATINGVETLNVTATKATGASVLALTDPALTTLNLINTGGFAIDTGTLGAAVSKVDASGVTGAAGVTVTLNNAATTGANVTGSVVADTITGSNLVDVINGGGGADNIITNIAAQKDFLTGGAGADVFKFVGATVGGVTGTSAGVAGVVSITDFVAGTDKFGLVDTGTGPFTSATVAAGQTIATAATLTEVYAGITAIGASAAAGVASTAVVTVSAGAAAGVYLYVNDTAGAVSNATDMLVKITGLTGTVTAADFVFA